MGIFDGAKAAVAGRKAYQTHVTANKLADEGKPQAAKAKYDEALRLYGEADRLGLMAFNLQIGHAVLLEREGHFDRARDLLVRLSKQPTLTKDEWFSLRVQYSICQWKTGQIDKAIETIGRAAAHKENGLIYATLGMYLVDRARQTGDFGEALEYSLKGLDYDDEDASVLDNLGQLYEAMADADGGEKAAEYRAQSRTYFEKAHAVKPRQITTLYYLARIYHREGDDARARKLLSVRDSLYISKVCPVTRDMINALAEEIG